MIYPFTGNLGFSWSLSPGDYDLVGIEYVENGIAHLPVRARFTVPPGGRTVYIGDLALIANGRTADVGLSKAYDAAVSQYRAKFPDRPQPEDATMTPDEGPGTASTPRHICAGDWGISCTKQFSGVTPIRPAPEGFTPVDRLDPAFEWQPSTDRQVTYDIAVYEAADYRGYLRKSYVRGRLVAYQERLTLPGWHIDRALAPGQHYFWSVRLRRGDTISNWSTYSFFNFYLVGFSSGYGQWFGFATPAQ